MKRWALLTAVLTVAALAAMPSAADAQAKDTLVVALTSHAPTLDPHMHFERDFVEAACAIGASPTRLLLGHLLPNTFSSIIVMSTLQVAQAILQEAAL